MRRTLVLTINLLWSMAKQMRNERKRWSYRFEDPADHAELRMAALMIEGRPLIPAFWILHQIERLMKSRDMGKDRLSGRTLDRVQILKKMFDLRDNKWRFGTGRDCQRESWLIGRHEDGF